jgi:RNA polymerase sigma factor (sigma-70 family)
MMVGTALSALGTPTAQAAVPEVTARAVSDISRYCTACWRNARLHPDCWTDCTQEVFCRLLEHVPATAWDRLLQLDDGDERREFLRAIDAVKKRSQRSRRYRALPLDAVPDRHCQRERNLADDRQALHHLAATFLTDRQQQILQGSLEGCSVAEIATQMSLSPERVSDEKYKAIRKLRDINAVRP